MQNRFSSVFINTKISIFDLFGSVQFFEPNQPNVHLQLQSQTGIKLWYVTKFAFNATNNVAEYEVVIMALGIIK